jgi:hypothetical protein
MIEDILPRPVAKYLAGLQPEPRETLTPLLAQVNQSLLHGFDKEQILEILATNPVQDPEAELALLEALARLTHPLVPEILQAHFGRTPDKTRQKALKKAFHHLKAHGVEIPPDLVKPDQSTAIKQIVTPALVKGYMSRIEGNGSRMLILHLPRQGQSFNLFLALGNDVEGLKDTYAVLLSNKETKKYLDSTRQDMPGELVDVPPAYILKILEDFYQVNPDQSSEAVANYLRIRSVLQDRLGQEPAPDLNSLLPPLENREQYLEQAKNLPLEDDFLNWHLDPEILAPWLEKIREIENSPLVLSSDQKVARVERTMEEAIKQLYPPDQRQILSRRLLEMAYYLDHTNRPHLARQAQAAGKDLKRERSSLEQENPFLLGLVMFPLRGMYDMEKEEQASKSQPEGRILTDF